MDNFDIIKSYLLDEGFANSEKTAIDMMTSMSETWKDEIVELYKGKHGQSEKEYMDSRSDAGKQISGDSKQSGAAYSHRSFKGQGKPAKPGERQTHQGKMTNADRTELMIRKNALRKEAEAKKTKKEEFEFWVNELVEEGYDLSDYTWDEMYDIYEGYKEIDKKKESKMYRRAGNLARTALSSKGKKKEDAMNKSGKIVSAIARQKENERFSKMGDEKARDNYKEDYKPQLKLYMGQMDEETLNELGPLVGVLARVAGGAAARGIAARGAGIAAKGALRKKAVELAARKGGEAVEDKINNIVRKKKEEEEEEGKANELKGKASNDVFENVTGGPLLPGEGRKVYPKGSSPKKTGATLPLANSYEPEGEMVDEARRADKEGYARGTKENPERKDIPHGDVSQRSTLHSKLKRRADEMGRERRSSARNKAGGRTPVSKKEKAFLQAVTRTASQVHNPNVPKTGEHKKKIDENVLQNLRRFNPGAVIGNEIQRALTPPVADGTLDTAARNASPKGTRKKTTSEQVSDIARIRAEMLNPKTEEE